MIKQQALVLSEEIEMEFPQVRYKGTAGLNFRQREQFCL